MKKTLLISIIVLTIAMTACFAFVGCDGDSINANLNDGVDYSVKLKDYLAYPDAANVASMEAVERNVTEIFNDSSLTDAQKVSEIMNRATQNEIDCEYVTYFNNKIGTTTIGSNSGTLIYQRLRRQSDTVKDDTTLKLPINHNFGSIEANFVTQAVIRYVRENNKYYRMESSKMSYNEQTGLIEVANADWKKKSGSDYWDKDDVAEASRSWDDTRKTAINFNAEGIIKEEGIKLTTKTDENGNTYYSLIFSINLDVANADATTIANLENDNSGKNMKFEKCDFEVEIWECGLLKRYCIDETWSGKIGAAIIWYEGSADSKTEIVYSYSERDMDYSNTESIYQGLI